MPTNSKCILELIELEPYGSFPVGSSRVTDTDVELELAPLSATASVEKTFLPLWLIERIATMS